MTLQGRVALVTARCETGSFSAPTESEPPSGAL